MMNNLGSLSDLSVLAAITTIVVQLIKDLLPKKIPTQLVTLVVGILITELFICTNSSFNIYNIIIGVLMGCMASFISMNGFDALKNIWVRVSAGDE